MRTMNRIEILPNDHMLAGRLALLPDDQAVAEFLRNAGYLQVEGFERVDDFDNDEQYEINIVHRDNVELNDEQNIIFQPVEEHRNEDPVAEAGYFEEEPDEERDLFLIRAACWHPQASWFPILEGNVCHRCNTFDRQVYECQLCQMQACGQCRVIVEER